MSSESDLVTSSERLIGRVKWFNNKAGYGFITVTDGDRSGSDIFVHHSSVNVENQQYKYLVQGEYVEFDLSKTTSGTHEWQASNVGGIKGGKLMCETRNEFKKVRTSTRSVENDSEQSDYVARQDRPPNKRPTLRSRGEGPREGDTKEWTLVSGQSEIKNRGRAQRQSLPSESK
jgi:CspA family cold shock protein